jgi:putative ubiquitin-RnfH superfamily antitoxin RatB of RatAB toxin-antitoxin module
VNAAPLHVTVAYGAPGVEAHVALALAPGATVADAVAASGFTERFALVPETLGFAIFGQRARADTPLADGDRVELTRPLVADPKTARRRRAGARPLPRPQPRARARR